MKKVVLHTTGKVKGKYLPPGTVVDLEDAEAASLVARQLADWPEPAAAPDKFGKLSAE